MIETEAVSPADHTLSPAAHQQTDCQQVKIGRKKGRRTSSAQSRSSSQDETEGDKVKKALVADYVSDVSSEDFSGPEDGECESDGGTGSGRVRAVASPSEPKPGRRIVNAVPPEQAVRVASVPALIENASPIEEDDDDLGLSKKFK